MSEAEQPSSPAVEDGRAQLVAANLRLLRTERGLSLNQVARDSGVSKATLSGLEAGRGNPTLATLFDIAGALNASPSDLLTRPDTSTVRVVRTAEVAEIPGPVVSVQFLDRIADGTEVVELYQMQVPHTDQPQHSPGHPGVEHLLVLGGRLQIGPEGHTVDVGPGDYVTFDGTKPHSYWAPDGPATVSYMLTYRHGTRGATASHPFHDDTHHR